MRVEAIRLIPWDVGCSLCDADFAAIERTLVDDALWEVLPTQPHPEANRVVAFRSAKPCGDFGIALYVFDDGVALFELSEPSQSFNEPEDFDPDVVISDKLDANKLLLGHDHGCSETLMQLRARVRGAILRRDVRLSGRAGWENKSFSYVFTYYFVAVGAAEASQTIEPHLLRLLNPLHAHHISDQFERSAVDLTWPIDRHLAEDQQSAQVVSIRPNLRILASWSTMCVVGGFSDPEQADYRRLQRSLQHSWFFCYISENHFDELNTRLDARDVAVGGEVPVSEMVGELRTKISRIRHVRSSMAAQSDFMLFKMLVSSSRLDHMIARAEETATIFLDRYRILLDERRLRSSRSTETILFFFAAVSAFGAYSDVAQNGFNVGRDGWFLVALLIAIILFLMTRRRF